MASKPDPDADLVVRAQKAGRGDTRDFETLIKRHENRVLTNCRYLTGSADDAQDLAQEVFVKAFFALDSFEGRSGFGTWIKRIKANHCLNFIRKHKDHDHLDIDDPALEQHHELRGGETAASDLHQDEKRARIAETLDALPDKLRVALIMRDFDGMAYQEIADVLEVSLSAAKMRIKRAREDFRLSYNRNEA